MGAVDLLSEAGQDIRNTPGVLQQAELPEEIIFHTEFHQHRKSESKISANLLSACRHQQALIIKISKEACYSVLLEV
jgi:hypothetical protein